MNRVLVTHERLLELVSYSPDTGVFVWLTSPHGRVPVGSVVGFATTSGHRNTKIDYKGYGLHRLAWFYVHGRWPSQQIDHINCDPADNRFANLRETTVQMNAENRRSAFANNKCGVLGVCLDRKTYKASIRVHGVSRHIGNYETPEIAHAAYVEAKRRLHAGCTL